MANSEVGLPKWRELYARDHDRIRLMWDEESGHFRVDIDLEDCADRTPPLTSFEAAKDCYVHARAAGSLGEFVTRNHAACIASETNEATMLTA